VAAVFKAAASRQKAGKQAAADTGAGTADAQEKEGQRGGACYTGSPAVATDEPTLVPPSIPTTRCALLCKAALEAVWHVPCGGVPYGDSNTCFIANDWHTALLPVYLQVRSRLGGWWGSSLGLGLVTIRLGCDRGWGG